MGSLLAGGRGLRSAKKKKKVANPFGKLFGKKAKSGSKLMRFPASLTPGKSVLHQISGRYNKIMRTKRLNIPKK
jgi:hypothetical protein